MTNSSSVLRRFFICCLCLATFSTLSLAAAEAKKNFDVPAGEALTTLKAAAQQGGVEIMFPAATVKGVKTNAVSGELTAREALDRMLAGTRLVATQDAKSGAFAVHAESSAEKNGASRRVNDPTAASSKSVRSTAEETVVLSPFMVSATAGGNRYLPTQSTSGGRVRVNILDSSQNISVLTSDVLNDTGSARVLDAMKYIPGVSESSIPNGLDRMNIRGFLTTSRTLDGITTQYSDSQGNLDPFIVERMEIVKGPNAILAPAANPGGTINNISKKPVFDNFGDVSIILNQYGGERAEIDLNSMDSFKGKLAIRVLAAVEDGNDYFREKTREHLFAPMLTYRFSTTTELTWQLHYIDTRIGNYYDGISIDPTAGTTTTALLYQGVPRDLNIYGPDSYRNDGRVENSVLFLTRLVDWVDVRVQYRHSNEYNENNSMTTLAGASSAAGVNTSSFDPLTGFYTPGVVYASSVPYTASPVVISPNFNRSGSRIKLSSQHDSVQVDLNNEYKNKWLKADTLLGYAYNNDRGLYFGNALTAPAVTLTSFAYSPDVVGAVNRNQQYHSSNNQVYASERLSLLNDRLFIDGSYSRDYWTISIDNRLLNQNVNLAPSAGLASYGVVMKPREDISLFYSHSQNAAILPIANLATTPSLPIQYGVQDEVGARLLLLNRIRISLSHYQISQNNTNVSNPANFAFPPPVPALPGLLTNRVARGWEFEVQGSITDNLSLVGGYTKFTNRNPFSQVFRGVAEKTASALLNYSFGHGSQFKGLAVSLGADYMCKRAGDDATGFTPAGVARSTSFYLPARTLVNLGIAYDFARHWRAQLYVDNVLNQEYLESDLSRGAVWPGTPISTQFKLTYKF